MSHPAFEKHTVLKDILPSPPAQLDILRLNYNAKFMTPGETLSRSFTLEKPEVIYDDAKEAEDYILIMIDPDLFTKNDPTGQVRHWLSVITFSDKKGNVKHDLTKYLPCTPGLGTGYHRYIFLLCENTGKESIDSLKHGFVTDRSPDEDLKDRMGFYAGEYIQSKKLTVVAATFMLVGADTRSTFENMAAGAQAVFNKATGQ